MEIKLELVERNKKYFADPKHYAGLIKHGAQNIFGEKVKVFLFGSIVKGNYTYSSDIDVLAVIPPIEPEQEAKVIVQLLEGFELASPFHIILCNERQYERWFSKYILDKSIEV